MMRWVLWPLALVLATALVALGIAVVSSDVNLDFDGGYGA